MLSTHVIRLKMQINAPLKICKYFHRYIFHSIPNTNISMVLRSVEKCNLGWPVTTIKLINNNNDINNNN